METLNFLNFAAPEQREWQLETSSTSPAEARATNRRRTIPAGAFRFALLFPPCTTRLASRFLRLGIPCNPNSGNALIGSPGRCP